MVQRYTVSLGAEGKVFKTGEGELVKYEDYELLKAKLEAAEEALIEKLGDDLCEYCPYTDYGSHKANTSQYNLCEGCQCKDASENYLENFIYSAKALQGEKGE